MSAYADSYSLNRNSRIVLYGAATIGSLLGKKLEDAGFRVEAYLDQRADEVRVHCAKPVFLPAERVEGQEEVVVILAVKNVFEHSRIANALREAGYKRVIYRPYAALNGGGSDAERALNDCYSRITEGNLNDLESLRVPMPDAGGRIGESMSGIIRREKDGTVFLYVPISMIFTEAKNGDMDFSILFLKPHLNFSRLMLGQDGGEIDTYLDYCIYAANKVGNIKITNRWKENVIRNRAEVFSNMIYRYNINPDFFALNAPRGVWNDTRKCFNVISGKHRNAFLAAAGRNYIPIQISSADFERYLADMNAERKAELREKYETGYCPPVENPYFQGESWAVDPFFYGVLRSVMRVIADALYVNAYEDTLGGEAVSVAIPDGGFLERYFKRMGCVTEETGRPLLLSVRWEESPAESVNGEENVAESMRGEESAAKSVNGEESAAKSVNGEESAAKSVNGEESAAESVNGEEITAAKSARWEFLLSRRERLAGYRLLMRGYYLNRPVSLFVRENRT